MHSNTTSFVTVAEVLEVDQAGCLLHVRNAEGDQFGWATLAIVGDFELRPGHEVVVAGDLSENAYVIGCLNSARKKRIETTAGAIAEIAKCADGSESLRVLDANQQLVFEYSPATGVSRLNVPQGNLEVSTPKGGICFRAHGDVVIDGQSVTLAARKQLLLTLTQKFSSIASLLKMIPGRLHLGAQQIDVAAQNVESQDVLPRVTSQ